MNINISFKALSLTLLLSAIFTVNAWAAKIDCSIPPNDTQKKIVWMDHCVRLNQVQTISMHNAYHTESDAFNQFQQYFDFGPTVSPNGTYLPNGVFQEVFNRATTPPPFPASIVGLATTNNESLTDQLNLGIRNLQIDALADTQGGRYTYPMGLQLLAQQLSMPLQNGLPAISPEIMNQPGYKVLHIPDADWGSSCLTFKSCLLEVKQWSLSHPDHFPIVVIVEVKQDPYLAFFTNSFTDSVVASLGYNVTPLAGFEPIDESKLQALDSEIQSIFSPEELLIPDNVRKHYATMKQAILAEGWPLIGQLRGKIIFKLAGTALAPDGRTVNSIYLSAYPKLRNAMMFLEGGSKPANDYEMQLFISNPLSSSQFSSIQNFVSQGYIVATKADANTTEGRNGSTTKRTQAINSGSQHISTDFPYAVNPFPPSTYRGVFQDGLLFLRCLPASLGGLSGCDSSLLEN